MSVQLPCGQLRKVSDPAAPDVEFRGPVRLSTLLDGTLQFRRLGRATASPAAPQYDVFYTPNGGRLIPVGQAWLKNSDKVDGGDFLSITLSDPVWPVDSVNITAFPSEDGTFRLVWTRPALGQRAKAKHAESA